MMSPNYITFALKIPSVSLIFQYTHVSSYQKEFFLVFFKKISFSAVIRYNEATHEKPVSDPQQTKQNQTKQNQTKRNKIQKTWIAIFSKKRNL